MLRKRLTMLLLAVLAAVCMTAVAWADYDYIERYDVTVAPNTQDGSLCLLYTSPSPRDCS